MIRVGTYNIWHGGDYPHKLATGEETIDLSLCAKGIRDEKIDICGMNEVRDMRPVGGADQPVEIAKLVGGYHSAFGHACNLEEGYHYGNALVSRFPVRKTYTMPLVVPEEKRDPARFYEPRALLVAEIETPDGMLTFCSVHFGLVKVEWDVATEAILNLIPKVKGPLVVTGDFNLEPSNEYYRRIRAVLTDAAEGREALTFPSDNPIKRIDYIFVNDKCRVSDCRVAHVQYSDHCPVFADIELCR